MRKKKPKVLTVLFIPVAGSIVAQALEHNLFAEADTLGGAMKAFEDVVDMHIERSLARGEEPFAKLPRAPEYVIKAFKKAWELKKPKPTRPVKRGSAPKGFKIGALCNRLHVNMAQVLRGIATTTDRFGATLNTTIQRGKYKKRWAGLDVWAQSAWADSRNNRFSLTTASLIALSLPPIGYTTRIGSALRSRDGLTDLTGIPFGWSMPKIN